MGEGFGMEAPGRHSDAPLRRPARYLIIIDSGGSNIARLFLDTREPAGEFDAATEEVTVMTRGVAPVTGASGPEWDKALQGHNAAERAAARVYTLDL
jgi:hypothetical protein